MIRKLGEPDRMAMVHLLEEAPQTNLYFLGNLATLGFEADVCEFWGDLAAGESSMQNLRGVLNRYMSGWAVYGHTGADWAGLGRIVDEHAAGATRLQDNPGGVNSFLPYIQGYTAWRITIHELMELTEGDLHAVSAPPGSWVRRATEADLDALAEFYSDAEQMSRTQGAVLRPLTDTRIWIGEAEGQIQAAALTNAEAAGYAMVGGVYTKPGWRGRGLSKAVCSAMCAELLSVQKRPVLYWNTPAAGAVYRRLGFRPIGTWRSVWLQPEEGRPLAIQESGSDI